MLTQKLNKIIEIEKETTSVNEVGTPSESYEWMKNTYADVRVRTGATEYSEHGALPFTRVDFTIRYDSDVNYKCRIRYDNQYYSIDHIESIGRNQWMKIRTLVWESELSNG